MTTTKPSAPDTRQHALFITCSKGLESLLEQELLGCGADKVRQSVAGVYCFATLATAYRIIIFSRLCNRVILLVAEGPVLTAEDLYASAATVDWGDHLLPGQTLAVSAAGGTEHLIHTQFIAQKIKDAIVDQFRSKGLARPDVSRDAPDLLIHAVIKKDRLSLGIDLAGASLHRRHYRTEQGEAPLKETLAAALLMRAGWPQKDLADPLSPHPLLWDPMCGSGTLLIEGVLMALDIAPGLVRGSSLTRWPHHDQQAMAAVVAEAQARKEAGANWQGRAFGSDIDSRSIGFARRNAERAGVAAYIEFVECPITEAVPPATPTLVICNPPYAERLGEQTEVELLYGELGALLRRHAMGAKAAVFTAKPEWGKLLGIHSHKQYALFNGALPAKLLLMNVTPEAIYQKHAAPTQPPVGQDSTTSTTPERPPAPAPMPLDNGAQMFANRLRKNLKNLGRWAQQRGYECYRLYDADMPEYAFAIDCYGEHIHMQEYKAPLSIGEEDAALRRRQAYQALCQVMEQTRQIPARNVTLKVRERQRGNEQYQPLQKSGEDFVVTEGNAKFIINLERYLDTGLFLDHRPIRLWIGEHAQHSRFLNLFCYTATATVHAALGGAHSSTSVDMSRTYMNWAARNFELNGIDPRAHTLVQMDCLKFLQQCREQFDLIFLDPPTFSNSKSTENVLDIQRDHPLLIELCMNLLAPDGLLIFSNNNRRFKLDEELGTRYQIEDCSEASIDKDFERNQKIHRTWFIRH
ncbi:MAG: bifunctional 23S rRNA (guanine(2069)-N(7))-methyltransferase RlmK/23S rRNA (guanine(2445)-N(2))-methyltransferase RlmL [Gammaproteobacteria bacterium]|nr:bifunctional 23S rRNA (guanine(2069)-N(7))-methyltransferase RlmK/23S rRNA (guanine(2445)-N(2))-methyltransferase RlmL [Gammaproteobacteria bacterium]